VTPHYVDPPVDGGNVSRETSAQLDRVEAKLDRLLAFAERAEREFDLFKAKGIFGMVGRFGK